ncbi:hypothetical protein [Streptomyces sp. NPDC001401]|uniref:hypothetical protein n=1 Tax=Streptomyces sp. NPDC001401 TaxID=3364570 RepID=UPI0036C163B0
MEKIVVQLAPSALHATAETLTRHLGNDNWQVNELIIDGIISLEGPHDRQIGMRLLGDGSSIQLWATGGTEPADHESIEGTIPLPHGHRWHTPVHIGNLDADKDPGVVLYDAITESLLPAFDTKPLYVGHRPWDPAPEPEADVTADAEVTAPAAGETDQPAAQAAPEPEPKPTGKRTGRPKAAAPAAEGDPNPSMTRKRTAATPAAAKAADKSKPRPARKRTPAKPATS